MMKTAAKSDFKTKPLSNRKIFTRLKEKEIDLIDYKSYQKLFVLLISFSVILIFAESPRELENICESYNPIKVCSIW